MSGLGADEHSGLSRLVDQLHEHGVDDATLTSALTDVRRELTGRHVPDLDSLHHMVAACRHCPAVTSTPYLPPAGWCTERPPLLLVGAQPFRRSSADRRLIEMLKTAGLSSSVVGYTSIVRCDVPTDADSTTKRQVAQACTNRFLFTEIERLDPTVICPVGQVATNHLLGIPMGSVGDVVGTVCRLGMWTTVPLPAQFLSTHAGPSATEQFVDAITVAMRAAELV